LTYQCVEIKRRTYINRARVTMAPFRFFAGWQHDLWARSHSFCLKLLSISLTLRTQDYGS